MIKNFYVEAIWSNRNKTYYINKGYNFTNNGDAFNVYVFDLTPKNTKKIEVFCDYCGKPYYPSYDNYLKCKSNIYCDRDCCKKCSPKKHKEVCIAKYGIESTNQLKEVIEKKRINMVLPKDVVEQEFINRGYILLSEYKNSDTPLEYICPKHKNEGMKTITYHHLRDGQGCKTCGREKITGENHYNWNGCITELNMYLRDRVKKWTFDSLKNGNFQCEITGVSKELEVHHLHNFKDIVTETLNNLKLDIKSKVINYTKFELEQIVEECTKLHYKYGFGVVLTAQVHKEFHKKYGKINNTREQYFEFKRLKGLDVT